jgi:hypothetical protein
MNNSSRQSNQLTPRQWLVLGLLTLVLIAGESFALYTVFTSRFPGGNDFFVRWLGGRELLLHGTMFGRLTRPEDRDEAYFAYPLYTLYFFWPLSLLPYAWAQAIWMTLLQFILLGSTILAIRLSGWQPPGWLFWLTVVWGILFYNGARAILLGQFSILVGVVLFLALWAIDHRRDGWAGALLAVTTIKPQMVFLVLPFLLIWALMHRRYWLLTGFGICLFLLSGSALLLVPSWPLDFARNLLAYSVYVRHGAPLENLLHYFLPANIATPLNLILSGLFLLMLLPGWWRAFRADQPAAYTWALMTTLIVGSLVAFRSATTNQVILYLPLFFLFRRLARPGVILLIELALMILMWGTFAALLEGNWEHMMMHGLLPAVMLLMYVLAWRQLRPVTGEVVQ